MRIIFVSILLLQALSFGAQTTFTVKEWMGSSRTHEPVSGGIAFPQGAAPSVSQLALFEGASEVPAQFFPLASYADGSVQWALVDFTTDLAAKAEKSFTLKTQPSSATASPAISVVRNGSSITISNGVLSFSFDTVNFKGIESLVYGAKNMLSGAGGVSALDLVKGTPDTNGPVTRGRFIYLGTMRATYRVEGDLYRGSCGGLGYSYMMTVYAGSPRIIIESTIRNSVNPTCGRLAKIYRAFTAFNLGFDPARTVVYDTLAGHPVYMYKIENDTIRSTRAFEDGSGAGLAVTEKWGGGSYENFLNRTACNGRRVEVEIVHPIPDTLSYGSRPANFFTYVADTSCQRTAGTKYVYYLQDFSNITSQITLECYDGALTPSALRGKMMAMKHRLIPHQAPADVSASGAFSIGRFGTLEDERAYHAKCGWQPSDPFTGDAYHIGHKIQRLRFGDRCVGKPDCAPWFGIDNHYDQEIDYIQGWLLQWIRYGNRDYFDLGEAFGRYDDNFHAYRTTGFDWDGQGAAPSYFKSARTTENVWHPSGGMWNYLTATRTDIYYGSNCHFFFTGLTDYYLLTGDPDALDACRDVYEIVKIYLEKFGGGYGPVDTSNSSINIGDRSVNRKLNYWIRYYEMTRDPAVLAPLKTYLRGVMKSKTTDPYYWQKAPYTEPSWHYGFPGPFGKYMLADTLLKYLRANRLGIWERNDAGYKDQYWMVDSASNTNWRINVHAGWMSYWLVDALENWMRLFPDDDDVRDFIIGFANYVTHIKCGYCGLDNEGYVLSDFPRKGMNSPFYRRGTSTLIDTTFLHKWDTAHAKCASAPRASMALPHTSHYNSLVPAVQVAGFRNTGFNYFLKQADHIWGYVSGNYPVPGPADQKAMYSQIGEWEFYHNDLLTKVVPLFYEKLVHADTVPPEAVTNLTVLRLDGNRGLHFSCSAPAGNPVSYQLKYFRNKPLADYPEYDYVNFDTAKTPWWYAANVYGEPRPSPSGSPDHFIVLGDFPPESVFYAAIRTRDSSGNLSRMSNLVRIDHTIAVEEWNSAEGALSLAAYPNPFNPAVQIRVSLPRAGMQARLSIFDAAGRLVWQAEPDTRNGKILKTLWQGKTVGGTQAASGVYFVKLAAENREIKRKIMMIR